MLQRFNAAQLIDLTVAVDVGARAERISLNRRGYGPLEMRCRIRSHRQ
jgi:hypothetical protein